MKIIKKLILCLVAIIFGYLVTTSYAVIYVVFVMRGIVFNEIFYQLMDVAIWTIIPTFFIICLLYVTNKIKLKKAIILTTAFIVLISTPIAILTVRNKIDGHFVQEKWLNNPENRQWMTDDMLDKNNNLKNMSKDEVIQLLGLPDFNYKKENIFVYELGKERGFGPDYEYLRIEFDNTDHVKLIKIYRS